MSMHDAPSVVPPADRAVAVVAEDLAGMRSQAFGLAARAGLAPFFCPVRARGLWGRVPAAWWPAPLRAVDPLDAGAAELVFSVGGTGGAVGAALRGRMRRVVQIQNPRMRLDRFDLVVANRHDEISGSNVLLSRTALHGVSPERLAAARAEWLARLAHLPRPLVAVLLGGSNGRFRLDEAVAARLVGQLADMMRRDGVGVAVTPSRRTGEGVCRIVREALAPLGGWVWDMRGDNPYLGLLACADAVVVTQDSVSMVSEAVAGTAPVMVVDLPGRSRRIGLFLRELADAGRIRRFSGRMEAWPVAPLDDTVEVAETMRRRLNLG
ncbi:mitochondrial fission ELM1 family protein [Gluconacetobacter sp. Hr-1-5]|uniref:mitochondrial fission ELM1 family protein n=1 Tax=Gluconacetobacter sp. Hr-1-5 TaxID=3395370 RepID=UPI003B53032D